MLQVSTGKFFVTDQLYRRPQRGVLYTNYDPLGTVIVQTVAGTLTPTTTRGEIYSFLYEVEEKLEAVSPEGEKEILVGTAAEYYLDDFSAIASFALKATFTPDIELAKRLLLSKSSSLGVSATPHRYIRRVFDTRVGPTPDDALFLETFVGELMGLRRSTYKAVMRAIRRYVNGLHRVADDLDLAYALLVASIESLAQEFDEFEPVWDNYPQDKRQEIDKVLKDVPSNDAQNLRAVLLKHEHLALARRYREFALNHITPAFFREEAKIEEQPVKRYDLGLALESAYVFRSKYVHTLRELPRFLTAVPSHSDIAIVEGKPVLTLHGLARVAHHVISTFIARAPKVETEEFDYRSELPNTVKVMMAPHYWIYNAGYFDYKAAPRYLNGLLSQFDAWLGRTSEGITDMRAVMERIENLLPGLPKPSQRRPLLTLYFIYHHRMAPQFRRPNWEQVWEKWEKDFDAPSVESLIAHIASRTMPEWNVEDWEKVRGEYGRRLYKADGIQAGSALEAAMTLALAERHRQNGNETRALSLVASAVEDWPGEKRCLAIEEKLSKRRKKPMPSINWEQFLDLVPKERRPRPKKITFKTPEQGEDDSTSAPDSGADEQ